MLKPPESPLPSPTKKTKKRSSLLRRRSSRSNNSSPGDSSDSEGSTNSNASSRGRRSSASPLRLVRQSSTGSAKSRVSSSHYSQGSTVDAPVLVYHESARSIVFRDHLRRAVKAEQKQTQAFGKHPSSDGQRTITTAFATELMDHNRHGAPYEPPADMVHNHKIDENNAEDDEDDHRDMFKDEASDLFVIDDRLSMSTGGAENRISNCFQPTIDPLPKLELDPNDLFQELLESPSGKHDSDPNWTLAEREVIALLAQQRAVVKTIKNVEWTPFLHRFQIPNEKKQHNFPVQHDDKAPHDGFCPFNSFVTSTSLLPPYGEKMRAFGSPTQYTTGVVFALPQRHFKVTTNMNDTSKHGGDDDDNTADGGIGNNAKHNSQPDKEQGDKEEISEDQAAEDAKTWSWMSGYSAKTEFNIDGRGNLINGRKEALVPLSVLRQYNEDYLTKEDYMIAGRVVKGGLKTVPYNEIFVRIGGLGRIVDGTDVATGEARNDERGNGRSFEHGLGLPIALFVRTASYGHLISLLRTKARLLHVLGEKHIKQIPLLLITPEDGIRVLTKDLQRLLLKTAATKINPFQNPTIAHKTKVDATSELQFEQKLEELIDIDDTIRDVLTPQECARLAGGFGATDDSVAKILRDAMIEDKKFEREHHGEDLSMYEEGHRLQDIVNEGLAAAVRSGDYYTSRQLLILYSLVASSANELDESEGAKETSEETSSKDEIKARKENPKLFKSESSMGSVASLGKSMHKLSKHLAPPPPPPPLDTDRLRSATNSDGLLAVLGAAQVLKAMQDGGAKQRTDEVILALDEWIEHGEQSMAFRISSWRDQRAAQGDLKIAMDRDSSFMAFVSNKAISNRRAFVNQLKGAVENTDFSEVRFLSAIEAVVSTMHSPCLRLELLQYVLGLDNRYSVAHLQRSVELAMTCLSISG